MKLICLICLAFVMMISLSSCNVLPPEEQPQCTPGATDESDTIPTQSTPDVIVESDPPKSSAIHTSMELSEEQEGMLELEPEKQDLPMYDDLSKIQNYMTLEEVYSIAGKPQRRELETIGKLENSFKSSSVLCLQYYIYDSFDCESVGVAYAHNIEKQTMTVMTIKIFPKETSQ